MPKVCSLFKDNAPYHSTTKTTSIPVVSKVPTIILGMGALFGFPEQSDVPSIAVMVGSRRWPLISSYGASGRTQSLKLKMIDSFFKTNF
ncbi:hypothetical protein GOBAR_AA12075 [Gossypium barbadense]|uniref:Uncharacterized protein n=1 Tax=Gossypium barbadense TaxID=3634 RepID=A0A2P5XZ18_GOSBA|nr:hypothetical protein GOBAR_AA12075 [Gossypium barbadense]